MFNKKVDSMGTYNKGILGPFSGKVGTVVGASWRGKEVMRSLPKVVSRTPTEAQALQRLKFTVVTDFLTPFYPVLRKFYGSNSGTLTRVNHATSYHMKNATVYVDPIFEMDYSRVVFTKGDLPDLEALSVTALSNEQLKLEWMDNSGQGEAKPTDVIIITVYEATNQLSFYSINAGVRSASSVTYDLPDFMNGMTVEVWASVASADGKLNATSSYLGSVVVI
jgi:hypothetical protein